LVVNKNMIRHCVIRELNVDIVPLNSPIAYAMPGYFDKPKNQRQKTDNIEVSAFIISLIHRGNALKHILK